METASPTNATASLGRVQLTLIILTLLGVIGLAILLFGPLNGSDEPAATAAPESSASVEAQILKALADNHPLQIRDLIRKNHFDPDSLIGEREATLMILATEQRKWECVKVLLDAGGDPNNADRNGATPIMFAVATNNIHIARYLLEHHVDTSRTVRDPNTKRQRFLRYFARTDEMNALLDQFGVP